VLAPALLAASVQESRLAVVQALGREQSAAARDLALVRLQQARGQLLRPAASP